MKINGNKPSGNLRISRDVVASIAKAAAGEVEHVQIVKNLNTENIPTFVRAMSYPSPVKIELSNDIAVIDIFVNLDFGANIRDVTGKIQANIKESVQNMTGVTVSKVNVHVCAVA